MKGYKCRMGIEEGTYRDCPALDIGGCGFTAEEGPPANCDAIEYELTPAAVHDAQQKAVAAAEEVSRRLAQLLAFKDWDDVGIGVLKEDAEEEWKVLFNALAQLRAVKEAE